MVREARPKDKKTLLQLYRLLFPELKKEPIDFYRFRSANKTFIVEKAHQVVGFVNLTFVQHALEKVGYIEEFFVKKEYRKKGIGKELVKKAVEYLKESGASTIFVSVAVENVKEALIFYKKAGFEECKGVWLYFHE